MSEGYNGWSNYETWLVGLWFGDMFADMAQFDKAATAEDFKNAIENYLEDPSVMPSQSSFVADCVNQVVNRVNWQEIADHYVEEDSEDDGQPDEQQEWTDFDPDC